MLRSSLQPGLVLVCSLLCSCISTGIAAQQNESLVFTVAAELLEDLTVARVAAIHLGVQCQGWLVQFWEFPVQK